MCPFVFTTRFWREKCKSIGFGITRPITLQSRDGWRQDGKKAEDELTFDGSLITVGLVDAAADYSTCSHYTSIVISQLAKYGITVYT